MSTLQAHYSAPEIEARILAAIREAGLNPEQPISPDELGALDHFHTGGLRASRELLELAKIGTADRVLDIGAGLGGSARLLASTTGCRVDCIEMSSDYCAGAVLLNRLTGLENRAHLFGGHKEVVAGVTGPRKGKVGRRHFSCRHFLESIPAARLEYARNLAVERFFVFDVHANVLHPDDIKRIVRERHVKSTALVHINSILEPGQSIQ